MASKRRNTMKKKNPNNLSKKRRYPLVVYIFIVLSNSNAVLCSYVSVIPMEHMHRFIIQRRIYHNHV